LAIVLPFDRMVEVVDINAARKIATVTSTQDWLTGAVFSPDGKTLAVAGGSFQHDGHVELWDVAAQRKMHDLPVRTNTARCVLFAKNGKEVFAGSTQSCRLTHTFRKGSVHRWNVVTGEELSSIGE
jgi:WD40 repeat protein